MNKWYKHLIGIFLFLLVSYIFYPIPKDIVPSLHIRSFVIDIIGTIIIILFFYVNYYWLLPLYYNNKLLYFFFVSLFFLLIIILPALFTDNNVLEPHHLNNNTDFEKMRPPKPGDFETIRHVLLLLVVTCFFSILLYAQKKLNTIELEKNKMTTANLLAQIKPHFLYNTLNTIYAMSIKKDPNTPNAIMQFSELMRYVTYKADKESINLTDEIAYLTHYINLQKLRLSNNKINFEILGIPNFSNKKIVPLILISFIENAFKHHANNSNIKITIAAANNQLFLNVINQISKSTNLENEGLGLINTKNRLNLYYKNKYILNTINRNNIFEVNLTITLND